MAKKFLDFRDIKWPGTWLVENDIVAAVPEVPFNRTMYIQQLTGEPSEEPQFVNDCQNLDDVFNTFKPNRDVEMVDENGSPETQSLAFKSMMDFGKEGIINQSDFLRTLEQKRSLYEDFKKVLTNHQLNLLLSNTEEKTAYLTMIESLIEELSAADPEE